MKALIISPLDGGENRNGSQKAAKYDAMRQDTFMRVKRLDHISLDLPGDQCRYSGSQSALKILLDQLRLVWS
ncbi:hypothetical protein [Mesorhizobium marinum]|uniref:hypothetical protein n=1 Tax=Mesorhizobium marinum TaxID=3228790 RepID=UPI0034651897